LSNDKTNDIINYINTAFDWRKPVQQNNRSDNVMYRLVFGAVVITTPEQDAFPPPPIERSAANTLMWV
jgi:hypothetical protein